MSVNIAYTQILSSEIHNTIAQPENFPFKKKPIGGAWFPGVVREVKWLTGGNTGQVGESCLFVCRCWNTVRTLSKDGERQGGVGREGNVEVARGADLGSFVVQFWNRAFCKQGPSADQLLVMMKAMPLMTHSQDQTRRREQTWKQKLIAGIRPRKNPRHR